MSPALVQQLLVEDAEEDEGSGGGVGRSVWFDRGHFHAHTIQGDETALGVLAASSADDRGGFRKVKEGCYVARHSVSESRSMYDNTIW